MGREVRRVPKDWQHPRYMDGRYVPLSKFSFKKIAQEWDEGYVLWQQGMSPWQLKGHTSEDDFYEDFEGRRPSPHDYMPDWPAEERTHYQMYENTSEGTPISPVMESPEELARWLVDNEASSFSSMTASYEAWLRIAQGGWAPSSMSINGSPLLSGVEAFKDLP